MLPISVMVRTRNNNHTLKACLKSIYDYLDPHNVVVAYPADDTFAETLKDEFKAATFVRYPHTIVPPVFAQDLPEDAPNGLWSFNNYVMDECIWPRILKVDGDQVLIKEGCEEFKERINEPFLGITCLEITSPIHQTKSFKGQEPRFWNRKILSGLKFHKYPKQGFEYIGDPSLWDITQEGWGAHFTKLDTPMFAHYGWLTSVDPARPFKKFDQAECTIQHHPDVNLQALFPDTVIPGPAQKQPILLGQKKVFHVLGLAHLPTVREISTCAYTQKILKLCSMLKKLNHKVIFYGVESSNVECDEFVQCLSLTEMEEVYGKYDYAREFFKHDGNDKAYVTFNTRAAAHINKIKNSDDFLLITMGNYQKLVADAVQLTFTVEAGIGYEGIFTRFKVFESYAWMHYLYGRLHKQDGDWYDCVIPNYFNPEDFPLGKHDGDYLLYMGRLIYRKGVQIAAQVSKELGKKLIIAGQGDLASLGLQHEKHIESLGAVGPDRRSELLGKAICSFAPTYYIEPFGGVAVEAMMCGTPVLTSDHGAFTETVNHGLSGWRCRTFDDFLFAVGKCQKMNHQKIRDYAIANYSCNRIARMYDEYFNKIYDLKEKGWYQQHPERTDLAWLCRY